MTSEQQEPTPAPLGEYRSILVAVDASDLSNRGVVEAAALGRLWGSTVTGAHVYAAKMHDVRFRQMEGGLPERYREEEELERQRDVHDDLITKGLGVITDSYLDQAEETCRRAELSYRRCSLEGKNYREMAREANSEQYDLLVLGAQGLGAVPGARLGTVCRRVVRRSDIDTLVIKDAAKDLARGPVVVAVDGSARAYGGLLSALALTQEWGVAVHVVSAFDPYYHYVAFNRIAKVLSAEAGRVFRFEEQEKLHEDVIDAGLAKIYQGHLDVSRSLAADYGVEVVTELLDGTGALPVPPGGRRRLSLNGTPATSPTTGARRVPPDEPPLTRRRHRDPKERQQIHASPRRRLQVHVVPGRHRHQQAVLAVRALPGLKRHRNEDRDHSWRRERVGSTVAARRAGR